ncbi:MAG: peptide synthase [Desulfobulbus propionicus]|nr:MAG: peptide synthase [Desulfobulbus propionicus]
MQDYNIGNVLGDVASSLGNKTGLTALVKNAWQSWTFAELGQFSDGFTALLHEQGVRRGDRVMLMVRPSVEFICLTFALFKLGAVVILIDPGMGYKNLLRCIGSVRPDILIGIPKAVLLSKLFPKPFASLRARICVGKSFLFRSAVITLPAGDEAARLAQQRNALDQFQAAQDDLAAIIFTTGSTGPPKGVQYTHGIFHTQLELIRDYFGITAEDIDQPGFPLFGLFSIALGAGAVIPDMDPTRPAQVNPEKFVQSILAHQVSYSFGSPAIWNVVATYCLQHQLRLPLRKILMAGAPVPGELIQRVQKIMEENGQIYTPYGATESLPIASIEGREVTGQTWAETQQGKGTCVGRPLPGITIKIIATTDEPIVSWEDVTELPTGEIGEIVVQGPVVTRAYDGNEKENKLSKIPDGSSFYHRMGDMGYFDELGRLWFCGRKAHRVLTENGPMYTIPCEAIYNTHPLVFRSALVGIGAAGKQKPVLIVEPAGKVQDKQKLFAELQQLGSANQLTRTIDTFLLHQSFPVDIRHNAKIFREKLADWAGKKEHG